MKNQIIVFSFVFLVFIILVDLYTYRGISQLVNVLQKPKISVIKAGFLLISMIGIIMILWMVIRNEKPGYEQMMKNTKILLGYIVLFYVPKLFFILFLIIRDSAVFLNHIIQRMGSGLNESQSEIFISRADFLLKIGVFVMAVPFLSILFGIWKGRYNYSIVKKDLFFKKLPEAFDGLKIIQISDMHLGSFENDPEKIKPAIDLINSMKPDFVLFTGDMVNNIAREMEPFIPELSRISAKYGKYSILGNHDYGEYYNWGSEQEKSENLEQLKRFEKEAGFEMLNNDAVVYPSDQGNLAIIGVENWGEPPFPQNGDTQMAMRELKGDEFKILMSHDPSHWDAKVTGKTDIDLTLSGHTHGMQFAINLPGMKWSPVKLKYPRWSGLYVEGEQMLYVNIGLGYIAFPGRVGTPPEISFFTLKKEL